MNADGGPLPFEQEPVTATTSDPGIPLATEGNLAAQPQVENNVILSPDLGDLHTTTRLNPDNTREVKVWLRPKKKKSGNPPNPSGGSFTRSKVTGRDGNILNVYFSPGAGASGTGPENAAQTPPSPEELAQQEAQQRVREMTQKLADIIAINQRKAIEEQFNDLDPMVMNSYEGQDKDAKMHAFVKSQAEQWAKLIMAGQRNLDEIIPGLLKRLEDSQLLLDEHGQPQLDKDGLPIIKFTAEKQDEIWSEFAKDHQLAPDIKPENLKDRPELHAQFQAHLAKIMSSEEKKESFRYKLFQMGVISATQWFEGSISESDLGTFMDFVINGNSRYSSGPGGRYEASETLGSQVAVPTFYEWLNVTKDDSATEKIQKLDHFVRGVWNFLKDEHRELNLSFLDELSDPPTLENFQSILQDFMEQLEKYIESGGEPALGRLNDLVLQADGGKDGVSEKVLHGRFKAEKNIGMGKYLGQDILTHLNRLANSSTFAERFFELNNNESRGTQPVASVAA